MQGAYHALAELTRVSWRGILLAILLSRIYGTEFTIHAVSKGLSWWAIVAHCSLVDMVSAEEIRIIFYSGLRVRHLAFLILMRNNYGRETSRRDRCCKGKGFER